MMIRSFLLLSLVYLFTACGRGDCPRRIAASSVPQQDGLIAGGDTAYLTANIDTVVAECFKGEGQHAPAESRNSVQREPQFVLAATATVSYRITNDSLYRLRAMNYGVSATAVFEALSANDVILNSSSGRISFVRGVSRGNVSARIDGMSTDEMARVAKVRVRWQYGY